MIARLLEHHQVMAYNAGDDKARLLVPTDELIIVLTTSIYAFLSWVSAHTCISTRMSRIKPPRIKVIGVQDILNPGA
jgi:hypothetical protein